MTSRRSPRRTCVLSRRCGVASSPRRRCGVALSPLKTCQHQRFGIASNPSSSSRRGCVRNGPERNLSDSKSRAETPQAADCQPDPGLTSAGARSRDPLRPRRAASLAPGTIPDPRMRVPQHPETARTQTSPLRQLRRLARARRMRWRAPSSCRGCRRTRASSCIWGCWGVQPRAVIAWGCSGGARTIIV